MRLLLTGSHAYGEPRDDSDLDLVIEADPEMLKFLDLFDTMPGYGDAPGALIKGKLGKTSVDLIFVSPEEFTAWEIATENLIQRAKNGPPVTRDEAIHELDRVRRTLAIARGLLVRD